MSWSWLFSRHASSSSFSCCFLSSFLLSSHEVVRCCLLPRTRLITDGISFELSPSASCRCCLGRLLLFPLCPPERSPVCTRVSLLRDWAAWVSLHRDLSSSPLCQIRLEEEEERKNEGGASCMEVPDEAAEPRKEHFLCLGGGLSSFSRNSLVKILSMFSSVGVSMVFCPCLLCWFLLEM